MFRDKKNKMTGIRQSPQGIVFSHSNMLRFHCWTSLGNQAIFTSDLFKRPEMKSVRVNKGMSVIEGASVVEGAVYEALALSFSSTVNIFNLQPIASNKIDMTST